MAEYLLFSTIVRRCFPVLLGALVLWGGPQSVVAQGLSYTGSSTISETFLPEMVKAFTAKTGIAFGKIEHPGSTEGLKLLIAGEATMAGVSRALKSEEKADKPHYVVLGFDGNSVYVHDNNPVQNLSKEQLKDIFTGKITNWQQVGGPQATIEVVIGEPQHASTQEFQRLVLGGEAFRAARTLAEALICLRHVSTNQHAITFGSLALDIPGVKPIRVDNMAPTLEAIRSGDYPLRRPLLLVTKAAPQGDLKKFFDFAQSNEGQALVAKHFVPFKPLQTAANK